MKKLFSRAMGALIISACLSAAAGALSSCRGDAEYTVSFDFGTGSTQTVTVKAGECVAEPAALSDGEHILVGWFNGNKKWNFSTDTINSSVTLKAEWSKGYTDNLRYTFYGEYYSVSGYGDCDDVNITIRPEYKGYPVREIENGAFAGCRNLLSVYIPDCVDYVGGYAFDKCSSLQYVHMSEGVISMGAYAFSNCSSLVGAEISPLLTYLPDGAYYNCSSLSDYGTLDGVTTIGKYAFYGCLAVTDVELGSVTFIGGYAFAASGLKSVKVPSNVASLGADCFRGALSLTSATLECGADSLGDRCFYECVSLASVTVKGKISKIGERAFAHCRSLNSVYLSQYVDDIGTGAFRSCNAISSFTYGGSAARFSSISVGDGNECLTSAPRTFENKNV